MEKLKRFTNKGSLMFANIKIQVKWFFLNGKFLFSVNCKKVFPFVKIKYSFEKCFVWVSVTKFWVGQEIRSFIHSYLFHYLKLVICIFLRVLATSWQHLGCRFLYFTSLTKLYCQLIDLNWSFQEKN